MRSRAVGEKLLQYYMFTLLEQNFFRIGWTSKAQITEDIVISFCVNNVLFGVT